MNGLHDVKIVSDGTTTRLFIDGEDVSENCTYYRLEQNAGEYPILHIEYILPVKSLDVQQSRTELRAVELT